jgi:asparagine synthase (glutamine-hydrolysing)
MFAVAIWDRRSRRLVLARDRIGKKPLYYAATADAFLFGSEIKTLLAWPELPRVPDLSTIDRYLTWGYVPTPYTAFEGIRKLAAAHYLVVEVRTDGIVESEPVRYWRLPEPHTVKRRRGIADLQRELVG